MKPNIKISTKSVNRDILRRNTSPELESPPSGCHQGDGMLRESEERFRELAEAIFKGFAIHDRGIILEANPNLAQMFGWELPEILGRHLQEMIAPASRDVILPNLLSESEEPLEATGLRKDGSTFPVEICGKAICCEGRRVKMWAIRDISQRVRAREERERELSLLRATLESAGDGILTVDRAGKIVHCNRKSVEMWRIPESALALPDISQVRAFVLEQLKAPETFIASLTKAEAQPELEENSTCELKDGRVFECSSLPLRSGGEIVGRVISFREITERVRAEEELRKSKERFELLARATNDVLWDWDMLANQIEWGEGTQTLFGYSVSEIATSWESWLELLHPSDRQGVISSFQTALDSGEQFRSGECRFRRADGSYAFVWNRCAIVRDAMGVPVRALGAITDITQRKQAEEQLLQSQQMLQSVIDNIPQYIFWKDRNSVYLGCNRNFAQIAGFNSPAELIGLTDWDLPWKKEESDFFRECDAGVMERDTPECHITEPLRRADGKQSWVDTNKIPLHDLEGNVVGIIGMFEDITHRVQTEEIIRYQANYDMLTGLPNRMLFNQRLQSALASARDSQRMLAVIFLDLDRFKTINDTLSHDVGDRLLQGVAGRIADCLRKHDTLARWGGDEFTLLLPEISSAEDVAKIAERIQAALKPAFHLKGHHLHISSSMGIAIYPDAGSDTETLLKNADAALYCAKEQRAKYQFYTRAINSQASELLALENNLHQALKREEFVVYYQPQVNAQTGSITGMEALVRWQHPEWGLVSPAKFIPLAEETGLIVPLGEWVLQRAAAQNKAWQEAGLPPVRVAVNLSARQFLQPDLVGMVAQVLQATGLSPQCLELEITETVAMRDAEFTSIMLAELRQMGAHLSMDDFGTGYASLSYLKKFPFHTLKIDRSFVSELAANPKDAAIVSAIIALGQGLNLRVLAEGVETEAQRDLLRSLDCKEMQGYLFSKPLPAAEATQLLRHCDCKHFL